MIGRFKMNNNSIVDVLNNIEENVINKVFNSNSINNGFDNLNTVISDGKYGIDFINDCFGFDNGEDFSDISILNSIRNNINIKDNQSLNYRIHGMNTNGDILPFLNQKIDNKITTLLNPAYKEEDLQQIKSQLEGLESGEINIILNDATNSGRAEGGNHWTNLKIKK